MTFEDDEWVALSIRATIGETVAGSSRMLAYSSHLPCFALSAAACSVP
jgi:hypothetical protein